MGWELTRAGGPQSPGPQAQGYPASCRKRPPESWHVCPHPPDIVCSPSPRGLPQCSLLDHLYHLYQLLQASRLTSSQSPLSSHGHTCRCEHTHTWAHTRLPFPLSFMAPPLCLPCRLNSSSGIQAPLHQRPVSTPGQLLLHPACSLCSQHIDLLTMPIPHWSLFL